MMHARSIVSARPALTLYDGPAPVFVREIAVVGPGVVGLPMAALLASAELWAPDGTPARVTVVQRPSATSGWKVGAINAGRSPIGALEPDVDDLVAQGAGSGRLRATMQYADISDAEVVLVCVQTERRGTSPDYSHLLEALHGVATALARRTAASVPLVVIESTLAPTTLQTIVRPLFAQYGLEEGRDVLLAHSPSRLTRGGIVQRIASSDKVIGTLSPETGPRVAAIYARVVTRGTLHCTNAATAEVVKTLENASRDVRIAYAAEVARFCDAQDIDFFAVRRQVNSRLAAERGASAAPCGGLLVPTVGVGGHSLPKDGPFLWWRALEQGVVPAHSLILEARRINDESPAQVLALVERFSGSVTRRSIALLGVAYRADSDDARHSPTIALAQLLVARGARVSLHDPHVSAADPNLLRAGLAAVFHRDLADALATAEVVVVCVAHQQYLRGGKRWLPHAQRTRSVIDACNAYRASEIASTVVRYAGIGRGLRRPSGALIDAIAGGLQTVMRGVGNEAAMLVEQINDRFAHDAFGRVSLDDVRRLSACCVSTCDVGAQQPVAPVASVDGFRSRLVACAVGGWA
ncbi:MAG TPA: nucleotide sugar dehydrogenase [Gemmatimonadaceae bacterium]|nr:nucleotide sugar dehydrogenase [Gemmatimonadaceae bacterium]